MTDNRIKFLVVLLLFFTACRQKVQEIKPELRQLTEAVYASGTLQPENEYKVVSTIDGYLKESLVKEGDSVQKNQLLYRLFNSTRETQLAGAYEVAGKTASLSGARAPQVRELESQLQATENRLYNDSLQYHRYKNLYEQEAISKSGYDRMWLNYQNTLKDRSRIREQIRQVRLSSSLQLQQAENSVAMARTDKEHALIRSFTSGRIFQVYKQDGDLVYPNQPIALVGSGRMIARLLVDEDDLEKIYRGQKVLLTMDAYPDKVLQAHIEKVYPLLSKVEQSFRVDAVLDEPLPVNIYGLNMEANIVVAENRKAMVIPKKALLKGDSVQVRVNGKIKTIRVVRGTGDKDWVEIKSGLNPSSIIIINP